MTLAIAMGIRGEAKHFFPKEAAGLTVALLGELQSVRPQSGDVALAGASLVVQLGDGCIALALQRLRAVLRRAVPRRPRGVQLKNGRVACARRAVGTHLLRATGGEGNEG